MDFYFCASYIYNVYWCHPRDGHGHLRMIFADVYFHTAKYNILWKNMIYQLYIRWVNEWQNEKLMKFFYERTHSVNYSHQNQSEHNSECSFD